MYCMCGSMHGCLPPPLYVHRIYGNPSLWPSCFWLQIFLFFLSFFHMTTRKLLQLRLQVVFLTWSFLSRIVINIYTFIFQCNKDAIMYCTCAYFPFFKKTTNMFELSVGENVLYNHAWRLHFVALCNVYSCSCMDDVKEQRMCVWQAETGPWVNKKKKKWN